MAKSLILVESQQKILTLKTFLPETASVYNINGSDQDSGTEYVQHLIFNEPAELSFLSEAKLKKLNSLIKDSDSVYIATSPDLIGDALAHQLVESLGPLDRPPRRLFLPVISKKDVKLAPGCKKIYTTPDGELLEQAVKMDGAFDYHVRQVLNKKRAKRPVFGLAAALALKKICEQDRSTTGVMTNKVLAINVFFKHADEKFVARLVQVNGQPANIIDKHTAKALIINIKDQKIKVGRISEKSITTAPPLPLTTAKMIAVAETFLGFSPRQTMDIARSLYNGRDVGLKNPIGLITNPVSDSLYCPDEEILAAREYILVNYGKQYVPAKPRLYSENKTSPFSIIRPTLLSRTPKKMKKYLTEDQAQLYQAIWKRFLISQMTDATYTRRKVKLYGGPQKRFVFQAEQNQTAGRGYLQVFPSTENQNSALFKQEFQTGAELKIDDFEIISEEGHADFLYTEGLLIEALGELDACLSETLEFIPDILKEWKFIRQTDDGTLVPTRLGKEANESLQRHYPDILSDRFIRRQKRNFITAFHSKKRQVDPVDELLKLLQNSSRPAVLDIGDSHGKRTRQKCPVCGGAMKAHSNETGEFIVCENYPESCQYSKVLHDHSFRHFGYCPECDAELTVKIGRYGRFLACSKFPKCKFTKPYATGARCPKEGCTGEVIERTTKTGRTFYGCSFYPDCKFSSWQMPVNMACPKCGNLYLVTKAGESTDELKCPKCRAEYDGNLMQIK
jgi:DNA topoisomerase-1